MDNADQPRILPANLPDQQTGKKLEITELDPLRRLFRTRRFNCGDGLEEYGCDYRIFEKPAAATIPAHRHRKPPPVADRLNPTDPPAHEALPEPVEAVVRDSHLEARVESAAVELISQGRTLIVGKNPYQVLECGRRLAASQACRLLVDRQPSESPEETASQPDLLRATNIKIEGYLGRFNVSACFQGKNARMNGWPDDLPARFDLVLDLRPAAEAGWGLQPLGYYAPDGDDRELERILAELPEMIGVFEKPRFIRYRADLCAHDRSGRTGCSHCLDVCPTAAIHAVAAQIRIDHAACLGCGVCTVSCPTGALICLHAPAEDLLVALHDRLCQEQVRNSSAPTVVFHSSRTDEVPGEGDSENYGQPQLFFPVAEIGCVGPEVWLAALAYGAGYVILMPPQSYPPALGRALAGQMEWVAALLKGIGFDPNRIRLGKTNPDNPAETEPIESVSDPAGFAAFQSKRALIRRSVRHLAGKRPKPAGTVVLPPGAPFGSVILDKKACTLCLACAGACPNAALSVAGDIPALRLTEAECIQCGLCCRICPEQALHLQPQINPDVQRSELPRLLHAEKPLACIRCGKPFASPRLVEKLIARLNGHWMYRETKEIQRLKMCRDCRIEDLLRQH